MVTAKTERRAEPMTEREVARHRAVAPDDAVRAPSGVLPCASCGVGVSLDEGAPTRWAELMPTVTPAGQVRSPEAVKVSLCPSCLAVHEEATAYVAAHPEHVQRMGTVAAQRIESALLGFQILGKDRPASDAVFEVLWPRLFRQCHPLRFEGPGTLAKGRVNARPWTHVRIGARQELQRALADGLRDFVTRTQPPQVLACPSTGCLFCGVPSISRPAVEVARLGGPTTAASTLWRPTVTTPAALAGHGPGPARGHLCPACTDALEVVGAVGLRARGQALVNHVQATLGQDKARRLKNALEADEAGHLPAWAAVAREPNATPWAHLSAVIERL